MKIQDPVCVSLILLHRAYEYFISVILKQLLIFFKKRMILFDLTQNLKKKTFQLCSSKLKLC